MARAKKIEFADSKRSISDAVTKFGGQPVWLSEPQWPLSRELGVPMRFIGQIAIPTDLFPNGEGKIAYIFMTDVEEYVDGTWEPDGGENAVIIQPAENVEPPNVKVTPESKGPTAQRYVSKLFSKKLKAKDVELLVDLSDIEEPEFIADAEKSSLNEDQVEGYWNQIQGNKIGGAPAFIQHDEYPDDQTRWQMLLQLDSRDVPFHLNFGDAGVGHVFVDEQVSKARLLWQCH